MKKVFRLVAVVAASVLVATAFVAPATAATKVKVGLAYDIGGRGDKSFNDSAAAGLDAAKKKFVVAAKEVTVTTGSDSEREDKLRLLAKAGYNPIIAVGFLYAGPIKKVASDYPNTQFGIIDDASVDLLNVAGLVFAEEQGSYLAGVAAALGSKSTFAPKKLPATSDTSVEFVFHYYRSLKLDSLLVLRQQRSQQLLTSSTLQSHLISVVSMTQLRQRLLLRE